MGAMQRRKGKTIEREAAAVLETLWGISASRSQQFCGGNGDGDPKTNVNEFHFEVKGRAKHGVFHFLDQAKSDAKERIPIVLLRENGRREWGLLIFLDDAIDFGKIAQAFTKKPQTNEQI
jgi:hypothetical protein